MLFNYTDTLQHIFECYPINDNETLTNKQVIENARPLLFDFDYPIFDSNYKNVFETHFIRTFYIRQIGFDSYGLFKFQLETWLNIHMPYFNKLFESELINYDPLINFKIDETDKRNIDRLQDETKTINKSRNAEVEATVNKGQTVDESTTEMGTSKGETDSNSESSVNGSSESSKNGFANATTKQDNFNRGLETDTPQNRLAITTNDGLGVIEYASGIKENTDKNNQVSEQQNNDSSEENSTVQSVAASKDLSKVDTSLTGNVIKVDETKTTSNENSSLTDNQSDSSVSNIKTVDDYISSKIGKSGNQSYAAMIIDYRNSFLRIERDIFKEMNQLFMLVY